MADPVLLAKAAASVLSNEKNRKAAGWALAAIFFPAIVLTALICSIGAGGAEHNNAAVSACFYGSSFSEEVPAAFRGHVAEMQSAFSLLDSAVRSVNASAEGGGLDPIRVKAVFYALCFGEEAPSRREADRFAGCFYAAEERVRTVKVEQADGTITTEEETYTVNIPLPLERAYANLAALMGREITEDDRSNADHIYALVSGPVGGGSYDGAYLRGDDPSVELDVSAFTDPGTKNAADLAAYAVHAWESGWGYVWGTYGNVLTESLLEYKVQQYPDGVGNYEDFIRDNWLGGRTTDCVGLIKGYGWLDPESMAICYGTNGMPDVGANQMYRSSPVSGPISTMPDTPGLAVWMDGHIGVYIGGGEVVEASSTRKGVIRTKLAGRGWTHWLEVPYIHYE
ncbi:hypothetical protein [uncultured Dysosmobacter sp.]|uniref:hypothetical protein n=1 Tax=uncultured Dysosmobacter sp. TaxID=2591384 RepID=UPI002601607F|nr:hypothetical protein [uncultured Dysosmobacter sp.]